MSARTSVLTARLVFIARLVLALLAPVVAAPAWGQEDGGLFGFLRDETAEKYDLDPAAPDELLGVVLDADDQGVSGATVYLRPAGNWDDRKLKQTVTDRRGQFVFRRLDVGDYQLAAVSGGRASRIERRKWLAAEFERELTREPVVLTLKQARQIKLRVTDAATGEPVPGARVQLGYQDLPRDRKTDDRGEALVEGLLPRSQEVSVTAAGFAKQNEKLNLSGGNADLEIQLERGAVLLVKVVSEAGEPLRGARLTVRDPANASDYIDSARNAGADGTLRVEHAPADMALFVDVNCTDHLERRLTVPAIPAGQTITVETLLTRRPYGGAVRGVVLNGAGEPIAGAEVANWGRSSSDKRISYTDNEGRFAIDDTHRFSRGHELCVKAGGYIGQVEGFTPGTREEPAEVEIRLQRGNKLTGRVVDERGQPIRGARVRFGEAFWGVGERAQTDADGRFSFDTLPADATFDISARGYSDLDSKLLPLNQDEPVEVVLQPPGKLQGVIVDAKTGEAVPEFNVRITFSPERKPGDPSSGISSDLVNPGQKHSSPEGWFEINDLVVGQPFMVIVEADGYRPATLRRVEAVRPSDDTRAEFRLTPLDAESLTTVAGTITDVEGKPLRGVEVRLLASVDGNDSYGRRIGWYRIQRENETDDRVQQMLRASTDEQGRFRFEGVYSDLFLEVAYWAPGVAAGRLENLGKKTADERADLAITAAAAGTLTVYFNPEAFKAVSSVDLFPTNNDGRGFDSTPRLNAWRPEGDGGWLLRDVPAGDYQMTAQRYERESDHSRSLTSTVLHRQQVYLKPGETKTIRVDEARPDESTAGGVFRSLQKGAAAILQAASAAQKAAKAEPQPAAKGEAAAE